MNQENRNENNAPQFEQEVKDITTTSPIMSQEVEETLSSPEKNEMQLDTDRYAGFWMRFWAYLVDLIIIGSVNRILIYPVLRVLDVPLHDGGIFSIANICTAVIFYLYFVLMTKFLKQTLGKMIFGLKVVSFEKEKLSWSTIIFREWIGRFISGSLLILYVLVAFLPRKQGLHDIFADTTVIHDR